LCSKTGGSLYYYPNYDFNQYLHNASNPRDVNKIYYDLFRNLTRTTGYDATLTLRTSIGLELKEYFSASGRMVVRDLSLSVIDADKSIVICFT